MLASYPYKREEVTRKARERIYAYLAEKLGLQQIDCHIGKFDLDLASVLPASWPRSTTRRSACTQNVGNSRTRSCANLKPLMGRNAPKADETDLGRRRKNG